MQLFVVLLFILVAQPVSAQTSANIQDPRFEQPTYYFYKAKITAIEEPSEDTELSEYDITGISGGQEITTTLLSGDHAGEEVTSTYYQPENATAENIFNIGDTVIVSESIIGDNTSYAIIDRYRLPAMIGIGALFVILAIVLAGKRGLSAVGGLVISGVLLIGWMVPGIAHGGNMVLYGLGGALVIGVASIFIAHGFNKPTSIAVGSTVLTTIIAMVSAWAFVYLAQLYGTGSEEAYSLQQFSTLGDIDLRGLFLVGIVIGSLGVLDDVTTALTASVIELKKANLKLRFAQLFTSALRIGREHITSLINTLVLAYAGAAMPLLLFFTLDPRPVWVIINSPFMAEEIVRALVGSTALMLAVPITAFMAAKIYDRATPEDL